MAEEMGKSSQRKSFQAAEASLNIYKYITSRIAITGGRPVSVKGNHPDPRSVFCEAGGLSKREIGFTYQ